MTKNGAYEVILHSSIHSMEEQAIIIKQGALVDASIIDTPLKPKGKPTYRVAEDREEEENPTLELAEEGASKAVEKQVSSSVNTDGAWTRKAGKLRYGYKKHHVTDEEGLVLGVVTTIANVNEISKLEKVLQRADLSENISVKAAKGYQSRKNADLLAKRNLKNHMLKKARRNLPLKHWEKKFNKIISRTRYKVERTFGSIRRWFGGAVARYSGIEKKHTQNLMEAMCYTFISKS